MRAGELCTRQVVTARPDESVVVAARRMTEHEVGDVVVIDDAGGVARPIGIVTDRDLVTRVLVRPDPLAVVLRDLVDAPLVTADVDDDVDVVLARMRRHAVRRVPIVDATGALQGILTLDDLVGWVSEQLQDMATLLERQVGTPARPA